MRLGRACCFVAGFPAVCSSPILTSGEVISQDQCISSSNGNYHACLSSFGYLELYQGSDPRNPDKIISRSGPSNGKKGSYNAKVRDGALVISSIGKDGAETVVWSTKTATGDYLYIDNNGLLTLYQTGYLWDSEIWSLGLESSSASSDKVVEPVTGISFDIINAELNTLPSRCLGVGVRSKNIMVTTVNVYAVAFYVEPKAAKKALQKYSKLDVKHLAEDNGFFLDLMKPGLFPRYLVLNFAREVSAAKVVEALSAVQGVAPATIVSFQSMLTNAIGASIKRGETISLGWVGKNKMVIDVRGVHAGEIESVDLLSSVFQIYLGKNPVSPSMKKSVAEGLSSLYT